jgi:hypothetical protein
MEMDMAGSKNSVPQSKAPSDAEAEAYDRLVPLLEAAHREMTELSKKKQDGVVNALKIRILNRLLTELGTLLDNDPSRGFVELLDEETLPQNSDAVLLLSQWQAALKQYKDRHFGYDAATGSHRWFTQEQPGSRRS